jgi:hypothetical protein
MRARRHSVVVAVLALLLVPTAWTAGKKSEKGSPEPFGRFTVDQVERRLSQSDVHVFDGNPPEVYARNHVPGAMHLNTEDIKEGVLPADKNATLIFYCMNEL